MVKSTTGGQLPIAACIEGAKADIENAIYMAGQGKDIPDFDEQLNALVAATFGTSTKPKPCTDAPSEEELSARQALFAHIGFAGALVNDITARIDSIRETCLEEMSSLSGDGPSGRPATSGEKKTWAGTNTRGAADYRNHPDNKPGTVKR